MHKLCDLLDSIAHTAPGSSLGTQALTLALESPLTLHIEPRGQPPLAQALALILVRFFQLHKVTHSVEAIYTIWMCHLGSTFCSLL